MSLRSQTATVIFNPSEVDLDTLRTAIGRAGYWPKTETVVEG